MDPDIARITGNPYASPAALPEPPPVEQAPAREGTIGLIIAGVALLLMGYFTSNLFAIDDLYGIGLGPRGQSPLAGVFTTPAQQWLFYVLTASAAAAGCVLFGSQRFHSAMAVIFFFCPIATLVFVAGYPLRTARRFAIPISTAYLAIGTCLAGAGVMRLINLYGRPDLGLEPFLASLLTEAGAAMVAGAVLKLWSSGALSSVVIPQTQGDLASVRS